MKNLLIVSLIIALYACKQKESDMEKSLELLSYKFLVGTYTDTEEQGIDLLTFFPEKDSLSLETIAKGISNPSFILTGKN